MGTGSKVWIGASAGLTLVQIAASCALPRGLPLTTISDIVPALQMLGLLVVCVSNANASHGRLRMVWILLSGCWCFWLVDQGAWILYDVVLRSSLPDFFGGDALLFLSGVPILAALMLRPHIDPSQQSVRLGIVDFLQLMLWWIFIYAYLVICWKYASVNLDAYNRNFEWVYITEAAVTSLVLGLLWVYSQAEWRRFYALFMGAVVFQCLSIVVADSALDAKTYYNGSWYDTPFSASFAFFMVVAITGRGLAPRHETAEDHAFASWTARLAVIAVLSLPVIIVFAVLDRSVPFVIERFRVAASAIAMLALTALVFLKQWRLHDELGRANRTLEEAALTDPLTGVRNRRFFSATVEADVAQTVRAFSERDRSRRDLVFYLVDMDDFKEVNDLYGHDAGDRLLIESVRRIATAIRDSDELVRWGGEEFLIVSRSTDRSHADALASRVMRAISGAPFHVGSSQAIWRTCSIGWAAFPWLEDNVGAIGYEAVLNLADQALRKAKMAGKNQAIGATPPGDAAQVQLCYRPQELLQSPSFVNLIPGWRIPAAKTVEITGTSSPRPRFSGQD